MSDVIDADYKEGSALAVREESYAAPALFGTSDPVAIVESAVRVADALKSVVVSKKLIANIQGKEYPQVEAWLTLAAMLRLTTICEWSRRVEGGWEARVFVRDASGATVGAAEAQCLGSERSKKSWEDYALRSMAQTRATSKALRSVLGFVMVLAGYQATPAEEMPDTAVAVPKQAPAKASKFDVQYWIAKALEKGMFRDFSREHDQRLIAFKNAAKAAGIAWTPRAVIEWVDGYEAPAPVKEAATPMASHEQRKKAMALHNELGHDTETRHAYYKLKYGVESFNDLTATQASEVIDMLQVQVQNLALADDDEEFV